MKKALVALILAVTLIVSALPGLADAAATPRVRRPTSSTQYLIDSDKRLLTEEELWQWDRESLSFMFNEIFARHGFTFKVGGKFYNHFNNLPWYQAIPKVDNQTAYSRTTSMEWTNYHTIKRVIEQMDAVGHPYRKQPGMNLLSWTDIAWEYAAESLTGFSYVTIRGNQSLPVYSAPSAASYRGANGKATVSTNGYIYAAGWENGWLLVYYGLTSGANKGGIRVGYVQGSAIRGKVEITTQLDFAYVPVTVLSACTLTDDPLRSYSAITTLQAGTTVTYLSTAVNQNGTVWDYVETTVNGQTVRGYIPSGHIEVPADDVPDDIL